MLKFTYQNKEMIIRKYNKQLDESHLMKMIEDEDGWDYANEDWIEKYKAALWQSITYVAYENNTLCGYSRSIDDCGFYVYVCDLLVSPKFRGNNIGRKLMECIYAEYPNRVVYVMSDVDEYYRKIRYSHVGSIYEVPNT
jgi:GNAT superfamily N-acetyltransferase